MSYESKIYFVKPYDFESFETKNFKASRTIATIDVSALGGNYSVNFYDAFDTVCDFVVNDGDEELTEDKYGKSLKYASDVKAVLHAVMGMRVEFDYYMLAPLMSMLEAFKDIPDIKVVHFAY